MGSPTSVAILASSTRLAPLAITSTGAPDATRNTSDFAICPTAQPRTAAASADVRADVWYSVMTVADTGGRQRILDALCRWRKRSLRIHVDRLARGRPGVSGRRRR